ncbi:lytic exoenzyme target recognition domain-containing protein [Streptococcus tangpeifui]|uniref:lytic exoenzyme target recognition domain-containing protein n=1 Tax=Streptococcus tangpeifui TaxID=2709400 RepID=UPI003217ED23
MKTETTSTSVGIKRASAGATVYAYTKPVDGNISAGFNGYPGHGGIDYAVPDGTPVRAARDGVVKFAGDGSNHSWMTWLAGNCILIQHSDGMYTGYAHLSSVAVSAGNQVKQGQIIGYSGHTGYVTGPHLHFEMLPANPNFNNGYSGRIDPTPYIINAPYYSGGGTDTTPSTANNLKVYRVDDIQFINGIWQVKCDALAPTGFTWADNGIAAADIDEVDSNGNKTSDQVLQKGSYFVINPSNVRSVGNPLTGTGGLAWAQVGFAHGGYVWLRVNSRDNLLYGK